MQNKNIYIIPWLFPPIRVVVRIKKKPKRVKPLFLQTLNKGSSNGSSGIAGVPQPILACTSAVPLEPSHLSLMTDRRGNAVSDNGNYCIRLSDLSLSLSLSIYLYIYLSISFSQSLSLFISDKLSNYMTIYLSIYLSVYLSLSPHLGHTASKE